MEFIAILFGGTMLLIIIWLYMQDRIPKEDDNPNIEKIQNKLEISNIYNVQLK